MDVEKYVDLTKAPGEKPEEREFFAKRLCTLFSADSEIDFEPVQIDEMLEKIVERIESETNRSCSITINAKVWADIDGISNPFPVMEIHKDDDSWWISPWSEFDERASREA